MHIRVERHVRPRSRVIFSNGAQEPLRVHPSQLARQLLKTVGRLLGDAWYPIFIAQQPRGLLVKDLPGEQPRLLQHLCPIFRISVAVEIRPFIDKPLTARVDDDAERIVMLLELVTDRQVAELRRIHVPLHRVRARPMSRHRSAGIHRHAVAPAGVVAGASHLREIPVRPEITRPHFRIALKPTARQHHSLGAQIMATAMMRHPHATHAGVVMQQAHRLCLIQHRDRRPRQRLMQRLRQHLPTAKDVAGKPTPELEFPIHVERLAPQRRLKPHPVLGKPHGCIKGVADQHIRQIRVRAVFGETADIIEILLAGIGAEIDLAEIKILDIRRQLQQIVDTIIDKPKRPSGERGIPGARRLRCRLQHHHAGAGFLGGQRCVGGGIAGTNDDHVNVGVKLIGGHGHILFCEFSVPAGRRGQRRRPTARHATHRQ